MSHSHQMLDNQLCFSLYAASRKVTRLYQPILKAHGLTYPQYVVLMILWQREPCSLSDIGQHAQLNSNTLTPLLKRMELQGWLTRKRSASDERQSVISLTPAGQALQQQCACIPEQMLKQAGMPLDKAKQLKSLLDEFLALPTP
ncbi:MarR family winged helix-turn-helix transcriptional regulator [Pseudoalteromonas fenneropenaei]|uniref:MarR family winged helix-turn-helix transcriptional regulator n=1 Tax=Pseudoalteromonas fenneropenaei TaxID=1737459 RepID=A0ABV7CP01_9GAMM